jgi:hypothetical protein
MPAELHGGDAVPAAPSVIPQYCAQLMPSLPGTQDPRGPAAVAVPGQRPAQLSVLAFEPTDLRGLLTRHAGALPSSASASRTLCAASPTNRCPASPWPRRSLATQTGNPAGPRRRKPAGNASMLLATAGRPSSPDVHPTGDVACVDYMPKPPCAEAFVHVKHVQAAVLKTAKVRTVLEHPCPRLYACLPARTWQPRLKQISAAP